jgi:hypothetical protein
VIPKNLLPAGAAKEKADTGLSPTRTAVAGVAISGAFALLGLQLVRRRSGTAGGLSLMLVAGGIGLAAISAAALADIAIPGQPRRPRPIPPQDPPIVLPEGIPVTISIAADGDAVIFRVAPGQLGEPKQPPKLEPPPPPDGLPGAVPGAPAPADPTVPAPPRSGAIPPPPG